MKKMKEKLNDVCNAISSKLGKEITTEYNNEYNVYSIIANGNKTNVGLNELSLSYDSEDGFNELVELVSYEISITQ